MRILNCEHPNLPSVLFDPEAAKELSSYEVRARWPRGCVTCPDCNATVIQYASFEHYCAGDW